MLVIGCVVAYMYESYVGTAPFKVAYVDSKYRVKVVIIEYHHSATKRTHFTYGNLILIELLHIYAAKYYIFF